MRTEFKIHTPILKAITNKKNLFVNDYFKYQTKIINRKYTSARKVLIVIKFILMVCVGKLFQNKVRTIDMRCLTGLKRKRLHCLNIWSKFYN